MTWSNIKMVYPRMVIHLSTNPTECRVISDDVTDDVTTSLSSHTLLVKTIAECVDMLWSGHNVLQSATRWGSKQTPLINNPLATDLSDSVVSSSTVHSLRRIIVCDIF